jgi:hypothetical protein
MPKSGLNMVELAHFAKLGMKNTRSECLNWDLVPYCLSQSIIPVASSNYPIRTVGAIIGSDVFV